jgi:hypothetical protein
MVGTPILKLVMVKRYEVYPKFKKCQKMVNKVVKIFLSNLKEPQGTSRFFNFYQWLPFQRSNLGFEKLRARPQALLILIILLQFQILAAPKWVLKLSGEQYIINDVLLRRENMCKQIDISYLETVLLSVPFNKLPMVAP